MTLDVARADGVATLTLDRPESRNALTTDLLGRLRAALADIRDDPETRVVVLTGSGTAFCGGADLKELAGTPSPRPALARVRLVTEVIAALRNLEQPSIAAVNGAAHGAGWGLALACDVCFAVADASFSLPEVRKGLRLPAAIVTRLVEVVGAVRAAEIALGGGSYSVEDGRTAGWVTRGYPDATTLAEHASAFAVELAGHPLGAVSTVKQVLRRSTPGELTPPPEYAWNEE
ncbi:enoyl-CoA hydratase/isomerase family protein [Actinophytocola sp.]|uniref:enoyl-CoA hydratase/isomerase family protein n=1 Tax=Actinophytocola sp. TaxID=1872138 RepID=UPI003D6B4FEF